MEQKNIRLGINGLGRIGTVVLRAILKEHYPIEVAVINTKGNYDLKTIALRLTYDSVYGRLSEKITVLPGEAPEEQGRLLIGNHTIVFLHGTEPGTIPWETYDIDVVLECTGKFTDSQAQDHVKRGAKKVIISSPVKDETIPTYILGVNEKNYQNEQVISNGSCTTNCVAPIVKLIHEQIGFQQGVLTTIHAYTTNQNIVDGTAKDPRRARAAAINIVPTTTGAAEAVIACYPEIKGKFSGNAIRVPVVCGSYANIVFKTIRKTTVEEVNSIFDKASASLDLRGKLLLSHDPLVSSDVIGMSASCIIDADLTSVISDDMVTIGAWYDNEYGYSCRLIEMALFVGSK